MACATASILAGCSTNDCEVLRQVTAPSSGTEPGTLQAGLLLSNTPYQMTSAAPLAVRSDGSVMCFICLGIVTLDARLHEVDHIDTNGPASIAVAPDDASYVVTPGQKQTLQREIVALSPAGKRRWTVPIANLNRLIAGTEGPYAEALVPASDGSAMLSATIFGFDTVTGSSRTLVTGQYLLGAAHGGVFTVDGKGEPSVTLRQLDPTGNVVWSRAITSTMGALRLGSAVVTPDGGAIVFGSTSGPLDFGDRTLPATGQFIAGFDASGATQWAFKLDTPTGFFGSPVIGDVTLTSRGEILIASIIDRGLSTEWAFLSVATPAGISRTLDFFAGRGAHRITGLAVAPDGAAWVQVENGVLEEGDRPPEINIGDHTFTDEGTYLFKLMP